MFTLNHVLWLVLSALLITGLLLIIKFKKLSLKTVLYIMSAFCIISELMKILNNIHMTEEGGYLSPRNLPFHLCSIQIFIIFACTFFVKKEKTMDILFKFMYPTLLAGAGIALFIPTNGVSFTDIDCYQYFMIHAVYVGFALYIIDLKKSEITYKDMFRNMTILFSLVVCAIWINGALEEWNANFFYVSRPPMSGLPVLTLKYGWYVYFVHLLSIGTILMVALQLPFVLRNKKKNK